MGFAPRTYSNLYDLYTILLLEMSIKICIWLQVFQIRDMEILLYKII